MWWTAESLYWLLKDHSPLPPRKKHEAPNPFLLQGSIHLQILSYFHQGWNGSSWSGQLCNKRQVVYTTPPKTHTRHIHITLWELRYDTTAFKDCLLNTASQCCVSSWCRMRGLGVCARTPPPAPALWLITEHHVSSLCCAELPASCLSDTWGCVCVSAFSQSAPTLPSPLDPHVPSLRLRPHSFPANRFTSTIFLDSTHTC